MQPPGSHCFPPSYLRLVVGGHRWLLSNFVCPSFSSTFISSPKLNHRWFGGPLRSIWVYLGQLRSTWVHWSPLRSIWVYLGPFGSIWIHLCLFVSIRVHWGPLGSIWVHSGPSRFIWIHLDLGRQDTKPKRDNTSKRCQA